VLHLRNQYPTYIVPRRVGKGQEICAVGNVWYKKYKAA